MQVSSPDTSILVAQSIPFVEVIVTSVPKGIPIIVVPETDPAVVVTIPLVTAKLIE